MKKRLVIALVILAIVFGGTFAWHLMQQVFIKRYFATHQRPPVTVSTGVAKKETWHPVLTSIGTLQAINGVDINSEVTGKVVKIYFKSGQFVKKGDPLVQLDDAIEQEDLNNHLASLRLDTVNFQRQLALYKKGATSRLNLDTAQANLLKSKAQVMNARVMIAKKTIQSPFDGKLGIRQVNLGQYIKPGQSLVLLQSLNPLYVNFSLPEQHLKEVHLNQAVHIKTEAYKDYVFSGKVTAVNASVEVNTRSILVQATFLNNEHRLYPGLFADVSVILPQEEGVITVPKTAVTYSLYGDSVYLIKQLKSKSGKPVLVADQRFVTLGKSRGTVIAVKKGLQVGDQVVTAGQLKLHPGSHVIINNSILLH